ncbi:MAG: acyltransferase family protein [Armatimonadota bacterium]
MKERLEQLDSLRGLAALSVVFHHFLILLPSIGDHSHGYAMLRYTPLHIFWAGREAVILFFVLSGFVLSLPFYKNNKVNYPAFFAKRICRIYIPYIAAVFFAVIASRVFDRNGIPELSDWFNRVWNTPLDANAVITHIILIGRVNNDAFNPVIWSLVHEMRISLIFPLIMILVNRYSWKFCILAGCAISVTGFVTNYLVSHYATNWNDYGLTLQYTFMFILGALLAKYRHPISESFSKLSRGSKLILILAGVFLYTYPWWFFRSVKHLHLSIIEEVVISMGVVIFIVFALSSRYVSGILNHQYLVYMGKTSYSIYLYHAFLLISITYLLYDFVPIWFIWIVTLCATFAVSTLSYKYIELPSIRAGQYISKRFISVDNAKESIPNNAVSTNSD